MIHEVSNKTKHFMVCPVFRKNLDNIASMIKGEVPSFHLLLVCTS